MQRKNLKQKREILWSQYLEEKDLKRGTQILKEWEGVCNQINNIFPKIILLFSEYL